MNVNDLEPNTYCVITLIHSIIDNYPRFVGKYHTSNIVALYKGHYNTNHEKSHMFEHTVRHAHYIATGALTHVCINFIRSPIDMIWESHIYESRFIVNKVLTNQIRKVIEKFKSLLKKKKLQIYMTCRRCGLPNDIVVRIAETYYGKQIKGQVQ